MSSDLTTLQIFGLSWTCTSVSRSRMRTVRRGHSGSVRDSSNIGEMSTYRAQTVKMRTAVSEELEAHFWLRQLRASVVGGYILILVADTSPGDQS